MGAGTGETAVSNFYRPLLCEFRRQWIHLLLHRLRFPSLAQNFAINYAKMCKGLAKRSQHFNATSCNIVA